MAESNVRRSSVEREVMWAPWEGPGLEHLRLVTSDGGVVANGLVIGLEAGRPFRIGYEIRCDGLWRAACLSLPGPGSRVPLPCPARADACSRGADSVVVLQVRPRLFERQLRVSTDVDRQVVLVGHAVAAPHRTGPFDAAEHALEAFPRNAHGHNGFSAAAPRSPQVVAVVAAYGLRQTVLRAKEVYGSGLAVVAGEHASLGTFLRREPVVDAGDGFGHVLPAEPVGQGLRQLRNLARLHLYAGVAP